MATKAIAAGAKREGIEGVAYSQEEQRLTMTFRDGRRATWHGVPQETFYGMPTGVNLTNFIMCKLKGRFVMTMSEAPPHMTVSAINRTLTVWHKDCRYVYKLLASEVLSCPPDRSQAWDWFKATIVATNREPEEILALGDPTDEPTKPNPKIQDTSRDSKD